MRRLAAAVCDSKEGMQEHSTSDADNQTPATTAVPISPRTRMLGYSACALAGCLWGTGFYFGRLALNEMSVEWMVLYRFLFASLGMLPVMLFNGGGRVRLTGAEVRL